MKKNYCTNYEGISLRFTKFVIRHNANEDLSLSISPRDSPDQAQGGGMIPIPCATDCPALPPVKPVKLLAPSPPSAGTRKSGLT